MKLLIVDDEELTRTGVISSIDWQSIGIQEVLQADDGINGIEMARVHRPDIVLCDVRMPRLDGIAMLEQLEEILPDIVPVFMLSLIHILSRQASRRACPTATVPAWLMKI